MSNHVTDPAIDFASVEIASTIPAFPARSSMMLAVVLPAGNNCTGVPPGGAVVVLLSFRTSAVIDQVANPMSRHCGKAFKSFISQVLFSPRITNR